ncbi:MAG: dicarboxylate/amino acid:cation symporter, partial [Phycisphaerales bacterium]|nr:dicarboxylate/amino acid:cation symporter [Phycisphaerales bacterium]
MEQPEPKRRVSLATKILIGLVLGAAAGLACNLLFPAPAPDALGDMVRGGFITRGQADALAAVISAAAPIVDPLVALGDMVRTGFITQVQSDAVGAVISGRDAHARLVWIADRVMNPIGQVFLRMLFMVVVPLVFSSLALGVATVGDLRSIGRIGGRTFLWFVVSTAFAAVIGLTLVNWFQPGVGMDPDLALKLREQFQDQAATRIDQAAAGTGFTIDTFVNIVPKNVVRSAGDDREALGVIFFALMVGIACTQLGRAKVATFLDVLQGLYEVCVKILGYAMRLAPIGVFGLIFATSAKLGLPLLQMLGGFVLVALGGLLFHLFVVLGTAARVLIGINPILLFGRARGLLITAFSTSSSNATLPTTM